MRAVYFLLEPLNSPRVYIVTQHREMPGHMYAKRQADIAEADNADAYLFYRWK